MHVIFNVCRVILCLLAFLPSVALAKKPDANQARMLDTKLNVGDSYTLRAQRHGASQQFQGVLVLVNDRWIVLRYISKEHGVQSVPLLSKLPLVGHHFQHPSTPRTDEFLWIPREAATVEERLAATEPASAPPSVGTAPTLHTLCAVELAVGEKVVRHSGGMEALTDEKLTLSVKKTVNVHDPLPALGLPNFTNDTFGKTRAEVRYSREQLSCGDILCIRVPNLDPSVLTAQAH
ncbi:MAG TPA: hypothetical protein VHV08_08030 [Pirellulales bacterium]|nr:hypothetical protein [Pirellulales bacterium]